MSYGASLLTTYPSTLLSDGFVQRSSYENVYPSSMGYMANGRLMNDDLAYKSTDNYRPMPSYPVPPNSNGFQPNTTNHQQQSYTMSNTWQGSFPGQESLVSMNDITEYSESMGTASNTNTASSVARTIEDQYAQATMKKFPKPSQNGNSTFHHYNGHNQPPPPPPPGMKKTGPMNDKKPAGAFRAPVQPAGKKQQIDRASDNRTPVPSSQEPVPIAKDTVSRQSNGNVDIEAWLNDSNKNSATDETAAEQAWSMKIDQLQAVKAQREKDKVKSSRAIPAAGNRFEQKPIVIKPKANNNNKLTEQNNPTRQLTYFDSLFEGDFFKKPIGTSNYPISSSVPKRTKPTRNTFNSLYDEFPLKPTKYQSRQAQQTPRYEPPTPKRPPPTITTTSWRQNLPRHYMYDPMYPYYYHHDLLHHEYIHKDEEERYREALQVLRAERAEQQQKQIIETTAKRLNYGDYVRNSTKDGSLQNTIKPSPWSDFMDMKKGNIYSLSQEEKKQLYHQSKSYGERVRYRNIGMHYDGETPRGYPYGEPFYDDIQETQSSNVTPRQIKNEGASKSLSRTSKRPDSASTRRANGAHRMISNPNSQTTDYYRSDDDHGAHSDTGVHSKSKRLVKKRSVLPGKSNRRAAATSETDDSDTERENRTVHFKTPRQKNEQLSTVREERTLESIEGKRLKKITDKQKK